MSPAVPRHSERKSI